MKLLLIEDDEQTSNLVKAGLEQMGYTVDRIFDGGEGERRIELYHSDYDLVILDLMLPTKNGLEICKSVREKDITVPILILTAKGFIDDKVSALDNGADDYLMKPFELRELSARIRAILRRPKESLPPELQVGDIVLNPTAKRVYCEGKEIKLPLKEFNLLEYLMRHPDRAVTRDEILFNIWDFNFNSFSNVVDVHVNNLRKKIEKGGKKRLETVRGVGYKLKKESGFASKRHVKAKK